MAARRRCLRRCRPARSGAQLARYDGVEHADSIVMDPHKWWFAPFDCAALLYREPRLAKAVHTQDASYLDVIHEHDSDINPSDLAYHLTRRARGLPLWFSHGSQRDWRLPRCRRALAGDGPVRGGLDPAQRPDCELIREPDLSVLLFRRMGWTAADYESWSRRLLESQRAFVTSSRWRGETVGRLVFLHPGDDDGHGRRGAGGLGLAVRGPHPWLGWSQSLPFGHAHRTPQLLAARCLLASATPRGPRLAGPRPSRTGRPCAALATSGAAGRRRRRS